MTVLQAASVQHSLASAVSVSRFVQHFGQPVQGRVCIKLPWRSAEHLIAARLVAELHEVCPNVPLLTVRCWWCCCCRRVLQAKLDEHAARKSFLLGHHGTGDSVQVAVAADSNKQ